jgi:hypothetical protein
MPDTTPAGEIVTLATSTSPSRSRSTSCPTTRPTPTLPAPHDDAVVDEATGQDDDQ